MTILQFAGGPGQDFINACIACGIAFIVPLVLGLMIGFDEKKGFKLRKFKSNKLSK